MQLAARCSPQCRRCRSVGQRQLRVALRRSLIGLERSVERKYPGTYNARRDTLEGAWSKLFGYHHGVMVVNAFYENVSRHKVEHRELAPDEKEANVVLEFRPNRDRPYYEHRLAA